MKLNIIKLLTLSSVVLSLLSCGQRSNEILYATTDNQKVELVPSLSICVTSNEVKPSGEGIIRFSVPIDTLWDIAFMDSQNLKSISLPEGTKVIANQVFYKDSNLVEVTLPSTLEEIWSTAFCFCGFSDVLLPESLKRISANAFGMCRNLSEVTVPAGVSVMEKGVFSGCTSLSRVTLCGPVTSIDSYAFLKCRSLETIELPQSLKSIGFAAFGECASLKSIEIPSSCDSIANLAFYNCFALETARVPKTCRLGDLVFPDRTTIELY